MLTAEREIAVMKVERPLFYPTDLILITIVIAS